MSDLFYYKRKVKVKIEPEIGPDELREGKENEESKFEERIVRDCFNINQVVRGTWVTEDVFTVLLNDGHEQHEPVKVPLFGKGGQPNGGYRTETKPVWYVSQIELDKEDADRLRTFCEIPTYENMKID